MAEAKLTGISNHGSLPDIAVLAFEIQHDGNTYQWEAKANLQGQSPQSYLNDNADKWADQIDEAIATTVYRKEITYDDYGRIVSITETTDPMSTTEKLIEVQRLNELARLVRAERNIRLSSCDWTQLPDSPLDVSKKAEWETHRQALRDVSNQVDFPENVAWPTQP